MLKTQIKQNIIKEHGIHDKDTGSTQIQIAVLTHQIAELTKHLKSNIKDNHSRLGLMKMVGKRKRLMDYLSKSNAKEYLAITKKLNLAK